MIPQQWTSPCGNQCTSKYAALTQIPWRVFCKKGCDTDGETWEEYLVIRREFAVEYRGILGLTECEEICYKDPVLKDHQWSAYIDRSPGADTYSGECFQACVSGCGYKYEMEKEKVHRVRPNRPPKPPCAVKKPAAAVDPPPSPSEGQEHRLPSDKEEVPSTSA